MLLELVEVPELSGFIVVKDNELSAVQNPVQSITIQQKKRLLSTNTQPTKSMTNSNNSNNNNNNNISKRRTNEPPKGVSVEDYVRKWLAHKSEKSDTMTI
ncbi:hypothetical protein PENNAL_c0009G05698 [Penicillium nalgiovense]|uniref:Uncharacterized protein n=1 Tax=Penicillium nalgiovense TaxID=60175 RepID=A0A1V6YWH7_PENNA|nr:hypothetical protein PENNAL_c0009G05698 [Penicillium nalgiovense]